MNLAALTIFWMIFVTVVGLNVGSFLNVAIARLPLEKSLLWPGSRCMSCLQPIRWYDNAADRLAVAARQVPLVQRAVLAALSPGGVGDGAWISGTLHRGSGVEYS